MSENLKKRNSNIKLLRIVSMLMILVLHLDFKTLGAPNAQDCALFPIQSFSKIFFEMLCISSANLFVFISGWFGINFKFKGFCKFLFQCIFILVFVFGIGIILGYTNISTIRDLLFVNAWFAVCYLFLYIIAPVLNSFCENYSRKSIGTFLIFFYLFQTLFGNSNCFIYEGYSTFSFMGIYILARYLRLYGHKYYKYGLPLYILSIVLLILMYYLPAATHKMIGIAHFAMRYTCPFNITACAGLIMWVGTLRSRSNKIIDFFAASAFSVYLAQDCVTWSLNMFQNISLQIFNDYSGFLYLLIIFIFIICVYLIATIIDQLRILVWNKISMFIPDLIFFNKQRSSIHR